MIDRQRPKVGNFVAKSKFPIGPRWKYRMFPLLISIGIYTGGLVYCLWLNF